MLTPDLNSQFSLLKAVLSANVSKIHPEILMKHLLFFFFVLLSLIPMNAQSPIAQPELVYLVRQPVKASPKAPLLLLLHGVGSNEQDLFSFANQLPPEFMVVAARAPYTISPGSYAWYAVDFSTGKPIIQPEQAEASRLTIIRFIEQLCMYYPVDRSRVFLGGFSQGAIMSYSVGLTHPELLRGIAAMSGRMLDEVKPQLASDEQLKHLNVFISHGSQDQVLPMQQAHAAIQFLKQHHISPEFHSYPAAHSITPENLRDLIQWLERLR